MADHRGKRHWIPLAFLDVNADRPSVANPMRGLDGLRGFAVLLVVASHTGGLGLNFQGIVGVWLFFALSAFLLARPFATQPDVLTRRGIQRYASRRLRRVLPAYYTVITLFFLLSTQPTEVWIRHVLFLRGDSVFWTLPQEMLFYIILPGIAAIDVFVFRRRIAITIPALLALAAAANLHLDEDLFAIQSGTDSVRFNLGIFATGAAFAYAFVDPRVQEWLSTRAVERTLGLLGLVAAASLVLSAPHWRPMFDWLPNLLGHSLPLGWLYRGTYGLLCGIVVFVTAAYPRSLLATFFSWWPLRALGLVSFSVYLVHVIVMRKLEGMGIPSGNLQFLATLGVSWLIAAVMYSRIERPFSARGAAVSPPALSQA